ncbi:MAG TPA: riboflavin synthase [Gemmatimonadaceae bacterium]|nr:riboflavin synthase [Gemmatimonadaceae bacterium]
MFTGIIDDIGTIDRVGDGPAGRELRVRTAYRDLAAGESIALDGVCLTVREHGAGWFTVAAVVTTLGRTCVGDWRPGTRVNLERAMRAGDRLGGHLVQGHVDDVGIVVATRDGGDPRAIHAQVVDVRVPRELADLMVLHGSVAVNGVSLTVNEIPTPETIQLSLIEYTLRHTTFVRLEMGQRVHVEADVIGKYVQRFMAPYLSTVR